MFTVRDVWLVALILVESALPEDISPGDVVVYQARHGRNVAHRVVGVEGCGNDATLVTRSDVPGAVDERVDCTQLIGRVVGVERAGPWVRFTSLTRAAVSRLLRR